MGFLIGSLIDDLNALIGLIIGGVIGAITAKLAPFLMGDNLRYIGPPNSLWPLTEQVQRKLDVPPNTPLDDLETFDGLVDQSEGCNEQATQTDIYMHDWPAL